MPGGGRDRGDDGQPESRGSSVAACKAVFTARAKTAAGPDPAPGLERGEAVV